MKTKTTASVSLRLPLSTLECLREAAESEGTSINQFVGMAVAEKLAALRTRPLLFAPGPRGRSCPRAGDPGARRRRGASGRRRDAGLNSRLSHAQSAQPGGVPSRGRVRRFRNNV